MPDDVPAVEALVRAAYGHYVERLGSPPLPMLDDYPARVRAGQLWVLDDARGLVGLVVLEVRPDHLYVDNVAVRPDAQGRGLGPALLAFAEERARSAGLPELRLLTNERMTENRALYARLGWTDTGPVGVEGRRAVGFSRPVRPDGDVTSPG